MGELHVLQRLIETGKKPRIYNAAYCSCGWNLGDLRDLGFAHKKFEPSVYPYIEEWWEYYGPGPITLVTEGESDIELDTGDTSPKIMVDPT